MTRIVLPFETPSKKNSRVNTRSGRSFPGARYRRWHSDAAAFVAAQARGKRVDGPCEISLVFVHGDLRRRDGDNGVSSVFDLLVDCGVLADDDWKRVRAFSVANRYERGNPRCEIEIREIEENGI